MTAAESLEALDHGSFDAVLQGFSCTSGDTSEHGLGMGNKGAFPEVDQIAEENLRVFNPRQRLNMLQRSLKIVSEELPLLPLYAGTDVYIVSHDLQWVPPVTGLVRASEMSLAPESQGR